MGNSSNTSYSEWAQDRSTIRKRIITTMPLFQIKNVPYDNKINDDSGSGAYKDIVTWKPARESPHFLLSVNGDNRLSC